MQARKIAEKKAKEYMTEAQREKRSLEGLFGSDPNLRVLKPAPFSWITFGAVPRDSQPPPPRFGTVEGIDMAFDGFMRAVFRLSPGEFAVTMNNSETMVYLVHLLEYDRTLDALLAQFGEEKDNRFMMLAGMDRGQIFRNWVDGLMKDAGVHWRRDPAELTDRRR
jgi:hypothetical protein